MHQYPLRTEVRIDWSEIDAFGHINNLAQLPNSAERNPLFMRVYASFQSL